MGLADRTPPTVQEFAGYRKRFSNWGRWGDDDQLGTLNHITPEVRRAAGALIREGQSVSLSHQLATRPGPRNPNPVHHHVSPGGTGSTDFFTIACHGEVNTHLDALCHVFTEEGGHLYNGRPSSDVMPFGARSGSIDNYRQGILTRGVLYDIPRLRGVPYATPDEPVQGWDLLDAAKEQGVEPQPGDAVLVRSGLGRYLAEHPFERPGHPMPGVAASAIEFLYETDAALLGWDALDAANQGLPPGMAFGRHAASYPIHEIAIPFMGMPLLDNADLEPLAEVCAELGRWEFHLVVAPLVIRGGTGSPVNPIATF